LARIAKAKGIAVDLLDAPLAGLLLFSVVLFAAAAEMGHRLGLAETREANVSTLEASVLGLLALMLSFTFAMAVARFDARRDAVLKEANAIGTAALRARLLPAPHNADSLRLLRDYVGVRLDLLGKGGESATVEAAITHASDNLENLWRVARAALAAEKGMAPVLYIQSLNDVFDQQEARLTAYRHRVPRIVFLALYAIAAVGLGFSGYASGLEKRRWRVPVYVVNLLVASVILLIQDIDRPDAGAIRVNQQPILDVAAALAAYPLDEGAAAPGPVSPTAIRPARASDPRRPQ
jgi:hypothetical protein